MANGEVTNGEIMRRLDETNQRIVDVSTKMDDLYMPRELLNARFAHLEAQMKAQDESQAKDIAALNARLTVMQNWQTWAVRLIIGTLITVLITGILSALLRTGAIGG